MLIRRVREKEAGRVGQPQRINSSPTCPPTCPPTIRPHVCQMLTHSMSIYINITLRRIIWGKKRGLPRSASHLPRPPFRAIVNDVSQSIVKRGQRRKAGLGLGGDPRGHEPGVEVRRQTGVGDGAGRGRAAVCRWGVATRKTRMKTRTQSRRTVLLIFERSHENGRCGSVVPPLPSPPLPAPQWTFQRQSRPPVDKTKTC